MQQLPLSITLRDDSTLESYYPGDNIQALNEIKNLSMCAGEQFVYLWGRIGVGRSHLLQGACQEAHKRGKTAVYLPLSELIHQDPTKLFEGLHRLEVVCIDDVDLICGKALWEEKLFYLFNKIRTANHRLLIASNVPPKSLTLQLPDLQSRLSWGVVYQLHPLNDEQLVSALQLRSKQRGLELTDEVGMYLTRRVTRSMPELYQLLDNLDKASLAAQRRLTIPFVKTCLRITI